MAADDDRDSHGQPDGCPGMWRLRGAVLGLGDEPMVFTWSPGALTEYECDLCGGMMMVPPGGLHPAP